MKTWRQIHMDFHTPPGVTVGDRFNARAFFDTLEKSHVQGLTFFAKCHHGYSYFNTKIGTRHPGLKFDLLEQVATEAEKRKMPLLIYFSLNVDEVFSGEHPEYVAQFRDGRPVDTQILQDGSELYWRWLCPNRGPWLETFFFPHVEECLKRYPCHGILIDMAGYLPNSCFCDRCRARMRRQGLDVKNEVQHNQFNSAVHHAFAEELRRRMDAFRPGLRLMIGCYCAFGEAMKARGVISEFYVESLAFQTGWFSFPIVGRYLSNVGLPVVGMTGRFLKNWGDFGTIVSPHQLKIQLSEHLTIGSVSEIGDHLHCAGFLEKGVYDAIRQAFEFIGKRQPYCVGMERRREAAILVPSGVENAAAVCEKASGPTLYDRLYGATKLLMEEHIQWDVLDAKMPWDDVKLLMVISPPQSSADLDRLEEFVKGGGALMVDPGAVRSVPELEKRWWSFLGIKQARPSQFPGSFYRVTDKALAKGLPEMAHYVHETGLELAMARGSAELARVRNSPFPRTRGHFYGHFHGAETRDGGPSLVSSQKGRVMVMAQPLLTAYLMTGYHAHRRLLANLLRRLLPRPLIATTAPGQVEITLGRKDGRDVVQFLAFVADRRHRYSFESVNERIPIGGFEVALRCDRAVKRIWDPVTGQRVAFRKKGRMVQFTPPPVTDHRLLLVE